MPKERKHRSLINGEFVFASSAAAEKSVEGTALKT
jgi:hypothetical protein